MRSSVISAQLALCMLVYFVTDITAVKFRITLTNEEEAEARAQFRGHDCGMKGHLSMKELRSALGKIVKNLTDIDMQKIMDIVTKSKNSDLISDSQFLDLIFLRKVFGLIDTNADGRITETELYNAFELFSDTSEKTVKKIMQIADFKGDGFVNFAQFVRFYMTQISF